MNSFQKTGIGFINVFLIYFVWLISFNMLEAQFIKLPHDEFQRKIIGDTLHFSRDGKVISKDGMARDRSHMDALIKSLKKDFQNEEKKRNGSDSIKAVLCDRIYFSYWAITLYDTVNTFEDSIYHFTRKTLHYARKAKNAYLTNESYLNLIQNEIPLPEKIKLLKLWTEDYKDWINTKGIFEPEHSPYMKHSPYMIFANLYKNVGAEEDALKTMNEMELISANEMDKLMAHDWMIQYYSSKEDSINTLKHALALIEYIPKKVDDNNLAYIISSTYKTLAELKMKKGEWDDALSLVPKMDLLLYCSKCKESPFWIASRALMKAKIYLEKKQPSMVKPYIDALNNKNLSLREIYKVQYEYYKQLGDTLQSYPYLEKYLIEIEKLSKFTAQNIRSSSKRDLDFAKGIENSLIQEQAEKEKIIRDQKLIVIEKENLIHRIRSESENKLLLSRAESAELQRKIDNEQAEAGKEKNKLEQEFQISLLNQDISSQKRIKKWLISGLVLFVLFGAIVFSQSRNVKRLNKTLLSQNIKIEAQRNQVESTLNNLQSTQSQLIQSEKMASLGELTAGIAHEIQNPLNFVNNFAEINTELLKELEVERARSKGHSAMSDGKRIETVEEEILINIAENESKILLHGRRADAIVKGMLQHSQKNVGVKEPTDINALAEEYLRLAYHGFRAKNANFSAELKLDLNPALPRVNVIPQDLGRVMLNLYNNAFWAVGERFKSNSDPKSPLDLSDYTPAITLSTKKSLGNSEAKFDMGSSPPNKIEIRIRDNGRGIPANVIDKIFQPFFTTKPTGEGTGLGLSLCYDIVKAHGGELKVVTEVEVGSEFIIELPAV